MWILKGAPKIQTMMVSVIVMINAQMKKDLLPMMGVLHLLYLLVIATVTVFLMTKTDAITQGVLLWILRGALKILIQILRDCGNRAC